VGGGVDGDGVEVGDEVIAGLGLMVERGVESGAQAINASEKANPARK